MGNCATRPKVLKGRKQRGTQVPAPETERNPAASEAKEIGAVEEPKCDVKADEEGTRRKSLSNLLMEEEGNESTNGETLLEPVKPEVVEPVKPASSEPMKADAGEPMKLKSSELVKPEAQVLVNVDVEALKAESFERFKLESVRQELLKMEEPTVGISETKQPDVDKPSSPTESSSSKFVDAPAQIETKEGIETAPVLVQVQEAQKKEALNSDEPVKLESFELVKPKSMDPVEPESFEPVKRDTVEPVTAESSGLVKSEIVEQVDVEPREALKVESKVKLEQTEPLETKEPDRVILETKPQDAVICSTPVVTTTSEFVDASGQIETENAVDSILEPTPAPVKAQEMQDVESMEAAKQEPLEPVQTEALQQPNVEPNEAVNAESLVKPEELEMKEPTPEVSETKQAEMTTSEFVDAPGQIETEKAVDSILKPTPPPVKAQEMQEVESMEAAKQEPLEPVQTEASRQLNVEPKEAVNAESLVKPEELEMKEPTPEVSETKQAEPTTSEFVDAPERIDAKEVTESVQEPVVSAV